MYFGLSGYFFVALEAVLAVVLLVIGKQQIELLTRFVGTSKKAKNLCKLNKLTAQHALAVSLGLICHSASRRPELRVVRRSIAATSTGSVAQISTVLRARVIAV